MTFKLHDQFALLIKTGQVLIFSDFCLMVISLDARTADSML
jgi:hypothetical protein